MSKTLISVILYAISLISFYVLFESSIFYLLRIFVVMLHESSHALATWLTGGDVHNYILSKYEGGRVLTSGGYGPFIATAGYLGSLIWGIMLLYFSSISSNHKLGTFLLGSWILFFTLFSSDILTITFGVTFFLFLITISLTKYNLLSEVVLKMIGLFSIVYVPHDIFSDTISRHEIKSDAYFISQEFGLSTEVWGWIWFVLSIFIALGGLYLTLKGIRNKEVKDNKNRIF